MDTFQSVQAILQSQFDVSEDALGRESRLSDLGIDSLSVVEVLFALEDELKVRFPDEPAASRSPIDTLGALVDYVDKLRVEQCVAASGVAEVAP